MDELKDIAPNVICYNALHGSPIFFREPMEIIKYKLPMENDDDETNIVLRNDPFVYDNQIYFFAYHVV